MSPQRLPHTKSQYRVAQLETLVKTNLSHFKMIVVEHTRRKTLDELASH
jgi:hypothetical protein